MDTDFCVSALEEAHNFPCGSLFNRVSKFPYDVMCIVYGFF
jgi:hypothetical protein